MEDLSEVAYVLKNEKASGEDMISNEMLKCILEYNAIVLLKFFNSALKYNPEILDWSISIIAPIHKKGSPMDPDNYRGISLISCVYKLFTEILNKRLMKYCKEKKILSEEQLGFMPGDRTSDAHLILHNLIRDYCHKGGKHLYSCFVDFSKAFDSIPRDVLFKKLLSYGIHGKLFNLLKNIYSNERCKIKIGNQLTQTIITNKGVRQGCILSPLLFNIFISDLPRQLTNPEHHNPNICENRKLGCILWADDLVLLSENEEGLSKMITKLADYSENNGLHINADKSKGMIFNKTGKLVRRNFKYKNLIFTTVREYKYLGFIITPSGEVTSGLKDLKSRAAFALVELRRKLGLSFRKYFDISLYLFDALIKPILMYMSDFWGCQKLQKNNPIELIQNRFLKQLLGVQIQTSTTGILLETGCVPLSILAQCNCIKNWDRIAVKRNCNILVEFSYKNVVEKGLLWFEKIKTCLSAIGLQNIWYCGNAHPSPQKIAYQRMVDIFHQNAFAEISSENSKLRTYRLFKTSITREPYLTQIKNVKDRISFTKLRLSNHTLMIEKGRHLNLSKDLRFCPFCPNVIEDEFHFLTQCRIYTIHRHGLINKIKDKIKWQEFTQLNDKEKFIILMSNADVVPTIAKHISQTLEIREFLLKKHKGNI